MGTSLVDSSVRYASHVLGRNNDLVLMLSGQIKHDRGKDQETQGPGTRDHEPRGP